MQGQERVHHVNFLQPHQRGVQHFSLPEYSENSGKCISITLSTQQVGLASAMAVVLLLIIFAATILQKLFFKLVFRSSDADNEEYTRRKRLRRERRWKKEAV